MTRPAPEPDQPGNLADVQKFVGFEIERERVRGTATVIVVPAPPAAPEALLRLDPASAVTFWAPPGEPAVIGLGEARRIDLRGPDRFRTLEREAGALFLGLDLVRHPAAGPFVPSLFGGFAFAPGSADSAPWRSFGDGCFVLPRWTYAVHQGSAVLALVLADPEDYERRDTHLSRLERIHRVLSRPPEATPVDRDRRRVVSRMAPEEWNSLVQAARGAIAGGAFEKVVLARQTRLTLDPPRDPGQVMSRLSELQPDAYRFAFRRGGPTFLGATPEPLLVKRGRDIFGEALAGTAPREAEDGRVAESTDALAGALAASAKDLDEHRPVVAAIREALAPFCEELTVAGAPEVRALPHVLHLSTPVHGRLAEDVALARLVGALHPTPAMGGYPRDAALSWIAEHEPEPRGWYAGPVGRVGADGDGEFAVAIRCALLHAADAVLFAGAGIIAGSDPASEFEETSAKERTILTALGG